jgi:uncharacterized protein (DUF2235 family)
MKRIVMACDGTWNRPDAVCPTNVVKLHRAVAPVGPDGVAQRAFYEPGVGTARFERIRGGMFGFGLSRTVRDAYRLLATDYEPGDELYFFGFSRGAFTARSLAGLIGNCGILRPEHLDRLGEAYAIYRDRDDPAKKPSGDAARAFRARHCHDDVPIRFVGVWDTVGALGIPLRIAVLTKRWSFHDVRLGTHVRTACHALAIDERRGPFQPALWQRQAEAPPGQDLRQVWFSGVHSDAGGGYPDRGLGDITLLWMAEQAAAAGLALTGALTADARPDALAQQHESRKGFYRWLMRPFDRVLVGTAGGSAASSAWRRMREQPGYHPGNLRTYLATDPPLTAVRDSPQASASTS